MSNHLSSRSQADWPCLADDPVTRCVANASLSLAVKVEPCWTSYRARDDRRPSWAKSAAHDPVSYRDRVRVYVFGCLDVPSGRAYLRACRVSGARSARTAATLPADILDQTSVCGPPEIFCENKLSHHDCQKLLRTFNLSQ